MWTHSVNGLLDLFKSEKLFWRQFEIGKRLAAANDRGVIAEHPEDLRSWSPLGRFAG